MLWNPFGISWNDIPLIDIMDMQPKSNVHSSMRYYEATAANSLGIPFDRTWYKLSPLTRAYHIAQTFVSNTIHNLQIKQAQVKT